MIALVLSVVLSQMTPAVPTTTLPTTTLQTDVPRAVRVVDGQANIIDGAGVSSFVVLPSGMYLNEAGANKLNDKFRELQIENVSIVAENESLKNAVDKLTAQEGSKVSVGTVVGIVAAGVAVGAAVAAGVTYAVVRK